MSKSRRFQVKKPHIIRHARQQDLFSSAKQSEVAPPSSSSGCRVVPVGRRRDGGMRYWCLSHKSDATAKYGKPLTGCRASHEAPMRETDTFNLNIDRYRGGIALWGAVPAVYDTTELPMDRGIHVHARITPSAKKEMDRTFRAVRILGKLLPEKGILVSELDAIYYMATSIFGYSMKHVVCSYCEYPHLDKDWFSVHPHRRHLCAGCGKYFQDSETAIGNPILAARAVCGIGTHKSVLSNKKLNIDQEDFSGGIQIWGTNPAFIWTSNKPEEEGIHVHAFRGRGGEPDVDETYREVVINGVNLDPSMVRLLMAQSALPSIKSRVLPVDCPSCGDPQFSDGEMAFSPVAIHTCRRCGYGFAAPGRLRKTIANPLLRILNQLAERAPREPQKHDLGLLPETI